MNFAKRCIVLISTLLALSACKAFDKAEPPPCPRVSSLADSVTLTKFKPGPGRDLTDVQYLAELTSYHGSCHYDPEAKMMHVNLEIGIDAERRPALGGRTVSMAYYIAIPTFYPDPKAKQILPVTLQFDSDSNRVHYTDSEVEVLIPMSDFKDLAKYEVFVGLQLTPEELAFNRQQKRGH